MIVARSIDDVRREKNSIVTVGTFDGVHRAHQEILREVVHRAKRIEGRSAVITFDPHPKEVVGVSNDPLQLLSTIDERIELLKKHQIDVLLILHFTYEFSQQSSHDFYERYVVVGTGVSEVVVGYDHMFGRNREGSTQELVQMGKQYDFSVFALHPFAVEGEVVSSTQVRRALAEGDIDRANKFLGYEYSLTGSVVRGDERGRTIGYPTANIKLDSEKKLIPAKGVYLVGVQVEKKAFFGMMNIGVRPTVTRGLQQTIEVHLFDFSEDIYGKKITVSFLKRLRSEQRFSSLEGLIEQLNNDKAQSMKYITELAPRQ
jgi:riboflavin kinase/FMN adenylyltransferase